MYNYINKEIEDFERNGVDKYPYRVDYNRTLTYFLFDPNKYPKSDYKIDIIDFIFDNFNEYDYRYCYAYIKFLIKHIKTGKIEIKIVELNDPIFFYMEDSGELIVSIDDDIESSIDEYYIYVQDQDIFPDLISSAKVKVVEALLKLNKLDKI